VQQATIGPLIRQTIVEGSTVYTDEYEICSRLAAWGYRHETVCLATGEFARDDDGDGFCDVHVNTLEGFRSLLRSSLRPHLGIPQEGLALYLGFRVRAQRPGTRQEAVGGPGRPIAGTTLRSIMSLFSIPGGPTGWS